MDYNAGAIRGLELVVTLFPRRRKMTPEERARVDVLCRKLQIEPRPAEVFRVRAGIERHS